MNIGDLIKELKQCNRGATVSSSLQSREQDYFYEAKVIRAEEEDEVRVNILVLDIGGKGITVNDLQSQLEYFDENLPVFVKEFNMSPPRRSFEILNVKKHESIVFLEIPMKIANIYKT